MNNKEINTFTITLRYRQSKHIYTALHLPLFTRCLLDLVCWLVEKVTPDGLYQSLVQTVL